MKAFYLLMAAKLIKPILDALWEEKYLEGPKNYIIDKMRKAADLTTFTEADDVLVEHIIEALGKKEYQDAVLDIIEDGIKGTPVEDIGTSIINYFREKLQIPDND